jgi:hypothetical protein
MINLWYVFNDRENSWLTDDGDFVPNWQAAREFHTQESAEEAAGDDHVVFGWVQ